MSAVLERPVAAARPDPALAEQPDVRPTGKRLGPGRRRRLAWVGPLALLLLWTASSATGLLDPRILSEPWTVVATAGELITDGRLQENLAISAQRAGLGLFFGIVVGAVLALLSGLSRVGEALIDGPVQIKRAIPGLALIPLLILWFGIDETMKVLTITLGVFVPVYLQTHAGLRGIDLRFVELAQTVGLSRAGFIRKVVLPGALPGFFLGLRFAVTGAWVSLVVVEQINATSGIGYMMELARTYGQTNIIVLGLAVYGILGLLSDGIVRFIERKALSWQRTLAA
ncbi:ABC transporter permease [Pseudarthrobacter sp902506025]|jgi:sulfonate transport system permease protein|uniref:Sulfonate transport system permease protein n=1 Tax=Pseudarthrobacter defluvii TaxID=410837 RepID=A0ABT9UL72_9MICC|nr:ABC transporter permease [Pseudarthrobacter defluvii]MDQ0119801.1 sulfonate transport system permease protein [Pseudarthrobacter defluvii]